MHSCPGFQTCQVGIRSSRVEGEWSIPLFNKLCFKSIASLAFSDEKADSFLRIQNALSLTCTSSPHPSLRLAGQFKRLHPQLSNPICFALGGTTSYANYPLEIALQVCPVLSPEKNRLSLDVLLTSHVQVQETFMQDCMDGWMFTHGAEGGGDWYLCYKMGVCACPRVLLRPGVCTPSRCGWPRQRQLERQGVEEQRGPQLYAPRRRGKHTAR
eukprot:363797-Chlamydomonas_euryale.AAC.8